PQPRADDLRTRCLVPLALRLRARAHDAGAGRVNANLGAVEHLEAQNVEVLRRSRSDDLGECRDSNAHHFAPGALLRLFFEQGLIPDFLESGVERLVVVAAVVDEA